jgi:ubiquinone/menaquinone biosynthesis C-methylase UbiE
LSGLLEYLPPVQQPQAPAHGANKYFGDIAAGYDAKRDTSPKWTIEQQIIERMISELPEGSTVLDCPVGTGRFLNCYIANKLRFIGMDRSGDMLVQSALKLLPEDRVAAWVETSNQHNTILPFRLKDHGDSMLVIGDACQTGLKDKSVDCACVIRLTRWLIEEQGPAGIVAMLKEMQRVSRSKIILTVRVREHKWAVTRELIESGLDGWRIAEDIEGYEPAYRVMLAEKIA